MIADVDERRPAAHLPGECPSEKDELVQIGEPFRDEAAGQTKPSEERPTASRTGRGHHLRFERAGGVAGGQTQATNENREAKICGLAKLRSEERKRAGGIQKKRQNFAALELTETK